MVWENYMATNETEKLVWEKKNEKFLVNELSNKQMLTKSDW